MKDSSTEPAAMIGAWHKETRRLLDGKIGSDQEKWTEIDKLCISVVSTSADYCAATMHLLRDGHEWPAKALMRCLGELNAKLTWCFVGCKDGNDSPRAITEKIQRWNKTACGKGIDLLEGARAVVGPGEKDWHEKTLEMLKKTDRELAVNKMPDLMQIFKQLGERYYGEIRPVFYAKFNSAVHIDPSVLSAMYGNLTEGCTELTRYCAAYACNINSLIRLQNGFGIEDIQREFKQVSVAV